MKNIGKPCAEEPHARFDDGAQAIAGSLLYPVYTVYIGGVVQLLKFFWVPKAPSVATKHGNPQRNKADLSRS